MHSPDIVAFLLSLSHFLLHSVLPGVASQNPPGTNPAFMRYDATLSYANLPSSSDREDITLATR